MNTPQTFARPRRQAMAMSSAAVLAVAAMGTVSPDPASAAGSAKADLMLHSAKAGAMQLAPGQSMKVGLKVRNLGHAKAPSTTASAILLLNGSANGPMAGRTRVRALLPGKTSRVLLTVTIPSSTPAGEHKLRVCLDAGKKVKEEREKNNCGLVSIRVLASAPPPPPLDPFSVPVNARLSGTFNLADAGLTTDAGTTRTWQDSATVNVEMNVAPDGAGRETYSDAGSIYTISIDDKSERTLGACFSSDHRAGTGHNTFTDSADENLDEIDGHLARTDHSAVDLTFFLRYDATTVRKSSGPADACSNTTTTTQATAVDVIGIDFKESARTATTITYVPTHVEGAYSTPSHWQQAAGTLTLTLK